MNQKTMLIGLLICLLNSSTLFSQHSGLNGISGLKKFSFQSLEKKVLPGKSEEKAPNGAIGDEDIIGNLGLVSLFYQNGCYTDGRYNNNDYAVEKGEISDSEGKLKFEAYRVYEPTHKALNFLASKHNIYYRFKTKQNYSVYQFENEAFKKIADVPGGEIKADGFTKINNLTVSGLVGYSTYLIVPSNTNLSVSNRINPDIEAAKINETALGDIYKFRYNVKGVPFDNIQNSFSDTRHFFCFGVSGEKTGIIWQDDENQSLYLTTIDQNLNVYETTNLPNANNGTLAAATGNPKGDVFYLTIFEQDNNPVNVIIQKVEKKTGTSLKNKLDVSTNGLNMYAYKAETACMDISGDSVLLMIARTMHKSGDGLNHQGGIAVLFDAKNLNLLNNFGQTSGHSFDNYLMVASSGNFVGMDLGDNYPRGVNLHRFGNYMSSKLVYTFKTRHGETADCWGIKTFPVYPEISTATQKFYKWSNDNSTYTNLGAVIEVEDGFLISYLGEPDKNGKAINNSEAGIDCSRNLGFVKVKKAFDSGAEDVFLSKGINEKGGFFTFGGWWSEQKNTGIVWLTNYKNPADESAKNLKTVKLQNGNILFIWELWGKSAYKKTLALKTDKDGNPIGSQIELGSQVRLDGRDDLIVKGNQVLIPSGNKLEKKIEVTVIDLRD